MSLHVYDSPEKMSAGVAAWISELIAQELNRKSRFSLVLSGGNTPKALYQLLAAPPYREAIDWTRIDFFWGDERFLPFTDERNNANMAFSSLLNLVPVQLNQVRPMRTDISPDASAADYEKILKEYFATTGDTGFDLVLLGMGDDGHTLSLFPGTPVVNEEKAWVEAFYLPAQEMYRITLTRVLVNQSRQIAFLTTGKSKSKALKAVLEGNSPADLYPSRVIHPAAGELHWFVDKEAASAL